MFSRLFLWQIRWYFFLYRFWSVLFLRGVYIFFKIRQKVSEAVTWETLQADPTYTPCYLFGGIVIVSDKLARHYNIPLLKLSIKFSVHSKNLFLYYFWVTTNTCVRPKQYLMNLSKLLYDCNCFVRKIFFYWGPYKNFVIKSQWIRVSSDKSTKYKQQVNF